MSGGPELEAWGRMIPNGPHTEVLLGTGRACCSDHSGDELAWSVSRLCSLGLMLHFHGAGWSRLGSWVRGTQDPLYYFVSFCVSVIISHQGFKKGSGALYGMWVS